MYIQKLTCFYSLIWQAHAFTKKVTTFYSKKGELGNKGRGVIGCLVEEDCLFCADKPKFCWTQTVERLLCKEQVWANSALTRSHNFIAFHNKVQRDYDKVRQDYNKVRQDYDKVRQDYDKVRQDYDKVQQDYDKVQQDYDKVQQDYDKVRQDYDNVTRSLITGCTKFTQLHVVTSQFVMFISCALRARIEAGTGSRHVNWTPRSSV